MQKTIACVLSSCFVSAQTFVVDPAGGPGVFTTVAAAVAAVPDGATLLVHPGSYGTFDINGKGLTVLGGPGVFASDGGFFFSASFQVRNTSPTQPVTVRGFTFSHFSPSVPVQNCAGAVLLEDLVLGNTYCACTWSPQASFQIGACQQVLLRGCALWYGGLANSNAVLERCTLNGYGAVCALGGCSSAFVALSIAGGTTQIVDCTIRGGIGGGGGFYPTVPNQSAIRCNGGALRILAPATIQAGHDPWNPLVPVPAIDGTGNLRIDPAVVVLANVVPAIAATLTTQTAAMPSVSGTSAAPGGAIAGTALGPVGNLVILLVGLPGAPLAAPGIADAFWLDPLAYQFAAFGVPQPGVPVAASIAVPNLPNYLGTRIAWQSVSAGAAALDASNPTLSLVR